MSNHPNLDDAIRAEYSVFGKGADKIVCCHSTLQQFTDRVNSHLNSPAESALVADRSADYASEARSK